MVKVLLADSQFIMRNKIKSLLSGNHVIKVVYETLDIKALIEKLDNDEHIDLILLGWYRFPKSELDWLETVKKYRPNIPVILLTMMTSEESIKNAFLAGASGYLLSNVSADELIFAIKHVANGNIYLSSHLCLELISRIPKHVKEPRMAKEFSYSENEIKLMQAIGDGLNNKDIAERFFLSKRSIESQRAFLIKKAGVTNTASLIKYACLRKLIH